MRPHGEIVLARVSECLGVTREQLVGPGRQGQVTWGRQVAAYVLREHAYWTLQQTAELLNRDHSTVSTSAKKVRGRIRTSAEDLRTVEYVRLALLPGDAQSVQVVAVEAIDDVLARLDNAILRATAARNLLARAAGELRQGAA